MDLHLTREADVVGDLLLRKVRGLGGEERATSLEDFYLAEPTAAAAAAGRRDEDVLSLEGGEQRLAARHLLGFGVVDRQLGRPRGHELLLGHHQEQGEERPEAREDDNGGEDRTHSDP